VKISEIGEFGLIAHLKELVGPPADGEIWIGDDTAVLRAPAGTILFTSDLLIEGIHFDLDLIKPEDLGYKSIAVNVSDVAAMGGTARRALVGMGLSGEVEVEWIDRFYAGMRECCDDFGLAIVGGDLSRSDKLIISVSMLGNPAGRLFVQRKGARVGDVVAVTGTLGASAAGHLLLKASATEPEALIKAHVRPAPRAKEAAVLRRFIPTAMIDVSDGFAADVGHICEASEVGVLLDASALPLADLTGLGLSSGALQLALSGGEDYELCFTISPDRFEAAAAAVLEQTGTSVSRVGEIVDKGRGRVLLIEGDEEPLLAAGWDHLRV